MNKIVYFSINGKSPFLDWANDLDNSIRARVFRTIVSFGRGYLGDCKIIAPHLYETRLFFGGGYRIYYTIQNGQIVIILCAGDKSSQKKDIARAKKYLSMLQEKRIEYEQEK